MPSLLQHRAVDVHASEPVRQHRRSRGLKRLAGAGIALAVAVPVVGVAADRIAGWANPFHQQVVDRSTTPLLLALKDLDQYHAATGTFQVVIDQEHDTRWVPSAISGERVSFLATGTVDAYVDFTGLGDDRVQLSPDGESATITLPAAQLSEARVDPAQSRVLDRDRGLLDRVGDALGDNPTDDTALYAQAGDRLESAAAHSDLDTRAEDNTRGMLTGLGQSLGVAHVTVTFEPAPGAAG
jgi:Protein of unknown function (DUF4230)